MSEEQKKVKKPKENKYTGTSAHYVKMAGELSLKWYKRNDPATYKRMVEEQKKKVEKAYDDAFGKVAS